MLSFQPGLSRTLPQALLSLPQWVLATREKVPLSPYDGRPASVSDARTWGTFEQACARAARERCGLGFVFTAYDPFVGVDFDAVRNPLSGEIESWVEELIESFGSYTEISPSGRGIHVIARANGLDFQGGPHKLSDARVVEIYRERRYFTMTGRALRSGGASPEVEDATDALRLLLSRASQAGAPARFRAASCRLANFELLRELFASLGVLVPEHGGKVSCPAHDDKRPSLVVSERGYKCFGASCRLGGGGAIALRKFIARLSDLELEEISRRTGVDAEGLHRSRSEHRAALREKRLRRETCRRRKT